MMSVSLLPARSPWKVFVMWARASVTPSRSSGGGCVSNGSMSNVPSALLMPATLPHRRRPGCRRVAGPPTHASRRRAPRSVGEAVGDESEADSQHPDVLADRDAGLARPDGARLAKRRRARVHGEQTPAE